MRFIYNTVLCVYINTFIKQEMKIMFFKKNFFDRFVAGQTIRRNVFFF